MNETSKRQSRRKIRILLCAVLCLSFVGVSIEAGPKAAEKIAHFSEDDDVSSMEFSPDGNNLAVGTFRTLHVNIWDWRKSKILKALSKPRVTFDFTSGDGIRYSPNGRLLAVTHGLASDADADGAGVVSIFDASTGAVVHQIAEPLGGGDYSKVAFSPDGTILYRTYDSDKSPNQFTAYSTDSWEQVKGIRVLPLQIVTLAVSPDGNLAALGGSVLGPHVSEQAQLVIIDLVKGEIIRTIQEAFPTQNSVQQLAWNPDGVHVAAGGIVGGTYSGPDAVRIYDVQSGAIVARESASSAKVLALRYTPNGKYLVESGIDGVVNIWDGQHTKLLQSISDKKANALAVSKDGGYAAISDGRDVEIWKLN